MREANPVWGCSTFETSRRARCVSRAWRLREVASVLRISNHRRRQHVVARWLCAGLDPIHQRRKCLCLLARKEEAVPNVSVHALHQQVRRTLSVCVPPINLLHGKWDEEVAERVHRECRNRDIAGNSGDIRETVRVTALRIFTDAEHDVVESLLCGCQRWVVIHLIDRVDVSYRSAMRSSEITRQLKPYQRILPEPERRGEIGPGAAGQMFNHGS